MWFCIWCCVCATVREERERIYSHQHSVRLRTRTWRATKTLYKMYYILYWALTRNQQRFICTIVCSYFEFLWIRHLPYNGPGISPGWKVHFDCCRCCAASPSPPSTQRPTIFFLAAYNSQNFILFMPKRHTRFDFGTIFSEINAGKKAHFIHTQTSNFLVVAVWVDVAVAGTRRSSTPRASLILFRANEKQQKKKHCWKDPKCKFNNPYYSIWYIIKQMLGREGKMIVKAQMFVTLL